ncbi:DHH phosphoesterase [Amniculicola lignicola CBS 123094]|uniref:DHH phosphoesterase n=1 Tax=Amniculicola lignicola CBS 123094 TaxID=1392246 RepID=A0A6A5VWN5_9PLEO|nr:DHH phosphoesterase [Amniculicola lignicola CBS 123094]
MRASSTLSRLLLASVPVGAVSRLNFQQQPIHTTSKPRPGDEEGVGHFSEWSRAAKKEFLIDWQASRESEWILVQGNEAGDLDSMTAALTWAYHLEHSTANTSNPIKAIALLQTPTDCLDLRPENKLALHNSQMSSGHRDLLTMDELPEDPETLSRKVKGIVLVDHAEPLRKWKDAKILSIFDHHVDRGAGPDAKPRIFEKTASCTTIVARQMLNELEKLEAEYHMPHELLELILSAIAIDSSGLTDEKTTHDDVETSDRILKRSAWKDTHLKDVMDSLDEQLGTAKKDLDHMSLRDLLRRDWKGDMVDTPSPRTPAVSLGFASVPYSMDEQIAKTEFEELFDWFAIHAAWTAQIGVDISVSLNKYKTKDNDGKKKKIREIVLVVRDDVRIDQVQADSLFKTVKEAIERNSSIVNLKPWHNANQLAPRQMVWSHESESGRKLVRPIIEEAVMAWD